MQRLGLGLVRDRAVALAATGAYDEALATLTQVLRLLVLVLTHKS
jgi:hypothetical protein